MSTIEFFAIGFVVIGAFSQAITGIGFGLVVGPFMVLCLGPIQGVIVTSVLGLIISLFVVVRERTHVDTRSVAVLSLAAGAVIPLGMLIAKRSSKETLSVIIGVLVLMGIASLASGFRPARLKGTRGAVAAGAMSGLMGYLGGVGGPAVAMYAVNSGWSIRTLRPTINAYFAVIGVFFLLTRGTPSVGLAFGVSLLVAMLCGLAIGRALSKQIDDDLVRKLILLLGALGGLAAIAKGLL